MTSNLVQSLVRGLTILETLAESEQGLRLTELARQLDLKAPTAHNLLATLVAKGFVVREKPGPVYKLGPAILSLADTHRDSDVLRHAEGHVRSLSSQFPGATVVYSVLLGAHVDVRLLSATERPGLIQRPRGRYLMPFGTASGLVALAYSPSAVRDAFYRRYPFSEFGATLWENLGELEEHLERVRRQGYANPHFYGATLRIVAAPVFGAGHSLCGVLGMAVPKSAEEGRPGLESKLIEAVVEHAAAISVHA